jgi:hypothetical protein
LCDRSKEKNPLSDNTLLLRVDFEFINNAIIIKTKIPPSGIGDISLFGPFGFLSSKEFYIF